MVLLCVLCDLKWFYLEPQNSIVCFSSGLGDETVQVLGFDFPRHISDLCLHCYRARDKTLAESVPEKLCEEKLENLTTTLLCTI